MEKPAQTPTPDMQTNKLSDSEKRHSRELLISYIATSLVLSTLFLFISKSLYNYPVAIMACLGFLVCVQTGGKVFSNPTVRCFSLLFFFIWLPMLLSLIDAVSFEHSWHSTGPYLRFLFMGIFVISAMASRSTQQVILIGVFCLLSFWCIDAITQVLFGINFVGYPYEDRHITGMFYPKNTIAHICAGLSPIYFELVRRHYRSFRPILIMLLPLFVVILLSGRRAAWIMLALSFTGYVGFYLLVRTNVRINVKQIILLFLVLVSVLGSIVFTHDATRRRVTDTLGIFSNDYESVNKATALRLPLWQTSIRMLRDNWLNGVGPRGYRYAYSEYAPENDPWKKSGQTHPHQLYLEVMAESGLLGALGLVCFVVLFYRHLKPLISKNPSVFPWVWPVFVIAFPFNTHMAFYGSYWSSFFWLLVTLSFSASLNNDKDPV
ncbi:MAG: hypothetical protein GKR93_03855 [Gammaproteobacteria bacterium]|nr:hypothetical protein [Gammaproteobacteria bacterium]